MDYNSFKSKLRVNRNLPPQNDASLSVGAFDIQLFEKVFSKVEGNKMHNRIFKGEMARLVKTFVNESLKVQEMRKQSIRDQIEKEVSANKIDQNGF